jgi:hypothetical protein
MRSKERERREKEGTKKEKEVGKIKGLYLGTSLVRGMLMKINRALYTVFVFVSAFYCDGRMSDVVITKGEKGERGGVIEEEKVYQLLN